MGPNLNRHISCYTLENNLKGIMAREKSDWSSSYARPHKKDTCKPDSY
jgi:hypothetical protein